MNLKYIVKENDVYKNIDDVLNKEFGFSTRLRSKLIKNKKVFLNNLITDTREKIKENDIILIDLNIKEDNSNVVPEEMPLDIMYEDDWFIAINKPAGIAIHPSTSHFSNSLANGVSFYFNSINLQKKVRPVNRLDVDTSGVVIFAKCEYIQERFSKQMVTKDFKKEYICLVTGNIAIKEDIIKLPIARKPGSIIERCVDKRGSHSITRYKVIKVFNEYSLVKCILETGRTHQIRVHFKEIGHPLLGDTLYGKESNLIKRQALHSYKIDLIHPISHEKISLKAELPSDIDMLI